MTRLYRFGLLVCVVLIAACSPPEEEVEEASGPEAPPPPTPQEIAQSIITELNLDMTAASTGGRLSNTVRQQMLNSLHDKVNLHNGSEDGKKAMEFVKQRVEKRIRDFSNEDAWQHVLVFIDLHKVFDPDSRKYGSLQEEAFQQLKKPKLALKGMPVLDGQRIIILDFEFPLDNSRAQERVAIGDELHGVRVVDVFGNNRGVTVEFLETGERDVVFLKGRS